jgi:WhiB family redox-sensing transcriptional regulator
VRLTTLLDSIPQGGSGPWNAAPDTLAPLTLNEGAASTAAEFDRILAEILPCRTNDAELWFAERQADVERAKALCHDCPLMEGCLAGALERHEPWGVWGGQVFVDGVVVATKRGRGRPRKVRPAEAA